MGPLLSFTPELTRRLFAKVVRSGQRTELAALLLHTIVFGSVCGALGTGIPDSFPTHTLLMLSQTAVAAAMVLNEDVLAPVLAALTTVLTAIIGDVLGVYTASRLGYHVNWPAALLASLYAVVVVALFSWRHRDMLSRSDPDDYSLIVLRGSQYALSGTNLFQVVSLLLNSVLPFKSTYYLTVITLGIVSLVLVLLSRASERSDDAVQAHGNFQDLYVSVRLPFGIKISSFLYGLPQVDSVAPNTPAALMGMRRGDVLVGVNRMPVTFATWKGALRQSFGTYELRFRRAASGPPVETFNLQVLQVTGASVAVALRTAAAGGGVSSMDSSLLSTGTPEWQLRGHPSRGTALRIAAAGGAWSRWTSAFALQVGTEDAYAFSAGLARGADCERSVRLFGPAV
eukprot:CAMPEP_0183533698 /NCGR_PEP_ID=MMETSP0371-20130417/26367_1 /TAXON_ID=268820 /ORGANISM="Peridinium aciculiferum, Strain PAER-2" /LENGTH=398 /DNA_ID=CAMNT_0025733965 /DNA_START=365 /DNA_END=1560 /DNA_ORIENTATION=+